MARHEVPTERGCRLSLWFSLLGLLLAAPLPTLRRGEPRKFGLRRRTPAASAQCLPLGIGSDARAPSTGARLCRTGR